MKASPNTAWCKNIEADKVITPSCVPQTKLEDTNGYIETLFTICTKRYPMNTACKEMNKSKTLQTTVNRLSYPVWMRLD